MNLDDKIMSLNLMDDRFMSVVLNHVPSVQAVLRLIFDDPQLTVNHVSVQDHIGQVQSRNVVLDVHATDESGSHYNIEIHNDNQGVLKKARYYGSSLDVNLAEKGSDLNDLPNVIVIFLCRKDVLKLGEVLNHIAPTDQKTGKRINMGKTFYFLNAEVIEEGNRLSDMMQYFVNSDPEEISFGPLSERVRDFKIGKEQDTMREYMYDWERKAVEEAQQKMAISLAQRWEKEGISVEDIAQLLDITTEEVEKLLESSLQIQS